MNLRPDITEAAARLTSGFDVSRELRQLGAHLREGETVYRLAAGVYGSGGGLMAVTNRRVLLLRDGRTGQASEGFPLERITAISWAGGRARGSVVVSDAYNTAELGQVEAAEGNSVVTFIRSLLPHELDDEMPDEHAALDERFDEQEALLTHGDLALAAATTGSANGTRSADGSLSGSLNGPAGGSRNGSLNGTVGGTRNGSANGTATAARSGRFAVPMKVRTPPERLDGLPEQKTAERPSRAVDGDGPDSGDEDRYDLRDQVAGLDRGRHPARDRFTGPEQIDGQVRFTGSAPVDGHGRYGDRTGGRRRARELDELSRDDFGRDDFARDDFARDDFARDDFARDDFARDDFARDDFGRDRPYGEQDHADRGFPERDHAELDQPRREPGYGAQASAPGLRGVEGSGPLAGEVPVSRLAEETGGTQVAGSGERDRVRRSDEFDRAEPVRGGYDRPGSDHAEDRAGYDRAEHDLTDASEETGRLVTAVTGRRGSAGSRRAEAGSDGPTSGRRAGRTKLAVPDRKWLLIGGAGVLTLAVVGGMIVATSGDDPTVTPTPAAVESAGPLVKITKVIDGDSVEVEGSVYGQVEIIGITAPRTDKEQCGAADSTAFATRTLAGNQVTLITDPSQPMTDRSGRRLASVRTDKGLDYATLAAQAGMVRYYEGTKPVAQAAEIKAAQAEAEKAERGLWGPPCNGRTSTSKSSSNSGSSSSTASTSSSGTRSSRSNTGASSGNTGAPSGNTGASSGNTDSSSDTGTATASDRTDSFSDEFSDSDFDG